MARFVLPILALTLGCGNSPTGAVNLDDVDGEDSGQPGDSTGGDGDHGSGGDSAGGDPGGDASSGGDPGTIVTEEKRLVVRSNGSAIGYLSFIGAYTIGIWDREKEILFTISDVTGFVAGGHALHYQSVDCSGTAYSVSNGSCSAAEGLHPNRGYVLAADGDQYGFSKASELLVETGPFTQYERRSVWSSGVCYPQTSQQCGLALEPTTIIPTAFPLPITIHEETP